MTALWIFGAAVFGLAFGSFGNVVIYRVPRSLSIVRPGSACPECGIPITGRDNIPVLSYVLLRAKCRHCGTKISARYPLVEAATAALAVGAVVRFGGTERAVFVAFASLVLLILTLIDIDVRRLPDAIVLPSTVVALGWVVVLSLVGADATIARNAVVCGAGFFAVLFVIAFISGGMGFGDVKLAGFIGIVTGRFGWRVTVVAVLAAFIGGGLVGVALLASGRKGRKDAIPFGPALAAGAVFALYFGAPIGRKLFGV
jgi:leader peptidase (prepilin peptidase)/N-methyltransferase